MAFECEGTNDNPVFIGFEYKGLADFLLKFGDSVLVFKRCFHRGWFRPGKLVKPPLKTSPHLVISSLDHLNIKELALDHSLHIRLVRVKILLGRIMCQELCIGIRFTIFLLNIKDIIEASNILSGNVDAIAYDETSHFLTLVFILNTCLLLIDGETLRRNDINQFLLELSILMKNISVTAESDIICIPGIVKVILPSQLVQLTV